MDMTDLKPDIFLGQGPRRTLDYILEALGTHQQVWACSRKASTYLQALRVLLLLLVDYTKTEVYFIGLVKVWLHEHHLRKGFFGVLKRAVSVVEDTDPIPKFGFLQRVSQSRSMLSCNTKSTFGSGR